VIVTANLRRLVGDDPPATQSVAPVLVRYSETSILADVYSTFAAAPPARGTHAPVVPLREAKYPSAVAPTPMLHAASE